MHFKKKIKNFFKVRVLYIQTILTFIILFFSSCKYEKELSEQDLLYKNNPFGRYGSLIDLEEKITIKSLLDNAEENLNEKVVITGKILEVCPMRGCWVIVKDNNSDSNIRVKVTDGEIVFPLSSKGKFIDAQGTFVKLIFSEEQARRWKVHLALEQGIELSENEVKINPSDLIEYRIIGEAANIY